MSHSKAFGMTNLGYKIRIPQKRYNRATITEKVYYENYWNRLYSFRDQVKAFIKVNDAENQTLIATKATYTR